MAILTCFYVNKRFAEKRINDCYGRLANYPQHFAILIHQLKLLSGKKYVV